MDVYDLIIKKGIINSLRYANKLDTTDHILASKIDKATQRILFRLSQNQPNYSDFINELENSGPNQNNDYYQQYLRNQQIQQNENRNQPIQTQPSQKIQLPPVSTQKIQLPPVSNTPTPQHYPAFPKATAEVGAGIYGLNSFVSPKSSFNFLLSLYQKDPNPKNLKNLTNFLSHAPSDINDSRIKFLVSKLGNNNPIVQNWLKKYPLRSDLIKQAEQDLNPNAFNELLRSTTEKLNGSNIHPAVSISDDAVFSTNTFARIEKSDPELAEKLKSFMASYKRINPNITPDQAIQKTSNALGKDFPPNLAQNLIEESESSILNNISKSVEFSKLPDATRVNLISELKGAKSIKEMKSIIDSVEQSNLGNASKSFLQNELENHLNSAPVTNAMKSTVSEAESASSGLLSNLIEKISTKWPSLGGPLKIISKAAGPILGGITLLLGAWGLWNEVHEYDWDSRTLCDCAGALASAITIVDPEPISKGVSFAIGLALGIGCLFVQHDKDKEFTMDKVKKESEGVNFKDLSPNDQSMVKSLYNSNKGSDNLDAVFNNAKNSGKFEDPIKSWAVYYKEILNGGNNSIIPSDSSSNVQSPPTTSSIIKPMYRISIDRSTLTKKNNVK